jgi:hypothetical protein
LIGEGTEGEVIKEQQICFGEGAQEGRAALEGMGTAEFIDQAWHAEAAYVEVRAAGGVGERGTDKGFPDAGRAGD